MKRLPGDDVLLYSGPGSSFRFLIDLLPGDLDTDRHRVKLVTADQVRDGAIFETARLFVMPGGEERHHLKELGEAGNANLRRFVEAGGQFLGLCAGAYYGARTIDYHRGLADEVVASRPLGFFNGVAVGSIREFGRPYDKTLASAHAASAAVGSMAPFRVFYHGGPYFLPSDTRVQVLARYATLPGAPAAIVRSPVGDHGGGAILSGIHPEFTSKHIETGFGLHSDHPDVSRLVKILRPDDRVRRTYWRGLLQRCGLSLSTLPSPAHRLADDLPRASAAALVASYTVR